MGTLAHDTLSFGMSGGRCGAMLRASFGLSCVAFMAVVNWICLALASMCCIQGCCALGMFGFFVRSPLADPNKPGAVLYMLHWRMRKHWLDGLCHIHDARVVHKPLWH